MSVDYDLIVIGAGSGGLAAAERAAAVYGARVAIVERAAIGGACVNYGCIPEKLLDYAASFRRFNHISTSYGWDAVNRHFNWLHFVTAKDNHIQGLNQLHERKLHESGAHLIRGHAAFLDAHSVTVADQVISADKILIAVGAKPVKPTLPGIEHTITWHELYHLSEHPKHIAVFGGSPIGVKVAGSLNALGSEVTQIIAEDHILAWFDSEISNVIQKRMSQRGIGFLTHTAIESIEKQDDRLHLTLSGNHTTSLTVDAILMDSPRRPNLTDLNLDKAAIQLTPSGAISVDRSSRTTQTNIFAVGDCTDRIPLTPSAIVQARAFVDAEFGKQPHAISYDWVPISIASQPEAATVGLSEAQARETFGDAVSCYHTEFRPLLYCLTDTNERTFIKAVVNTQDSERILGVHMVGDGAVDIIQSLAIALKLGATKKDLDAAIGIHPSSAEELFSM